jgi:hypothetical protein
VTTPAVISENAVSRLRPASREPVGSPLWWVDRLYAQLSERQRQVAFFDAYYRGEHPLPWLPEQARDEFRRILRMTRSNYMGLVCDAKAERIQVEGFRVAEDRRGLPDDPDDELWRIWQENDLDLGSDQAFLEAIVGGCSYLLVAPNPQDPATPIITVEHASQAIVEYEPGSSRRVAAAGLKVWDDDWTGRLMATLYLPGAVHKFETERPRVAGAAVRLNWDLRRLGGAQAVIRNPLGIVSLVELANNPRLLTGGRSLLADVTDIQDRINKTIADRLITQDFGAFPQKWLFGWPQEDAAGAATDPIDIGRDRIVSTDAVEATAGQWAAAPLDPYSAAKREDIKDIASRTRTPAQDLLGEMNNVNGETLKASQAGHVAVVKQMCRYFGEGLERTMRLAQRAAGLPPSLAMETVWANPEYRTEGELTDATLKKREGRIISVRQAREDLGYSVTQIKRLEQDDADEANDPLLERIARDLTGGDRAPAVDG